MERRLRNDPNRGEWFEPGPPYPPARERIGDDSLRSERDHTALGLSTDDMTAVFTAVAPGTSPTLTLQNLNTLFGYARLSASLKLSVPDLLLWIQLTGGPSPFGANATPAGTLEFLRRYGVLKATGIAVHDLDYLLRNQSLAERRSSLR